MGVRVFFGPNLEVKKYQLINSPTTFMDNLKSKYAMILKGEPQKTLIKAGVLNSDESFTVEGRDLFEAWLLQKYGSEFKADVADKIVAEEAKSKE